MTCLDQSGYRNSFTPRSAFSRIIGDACDVGLYEATGIDVTPKGSDKVLSDLFRHHKRMKEKGLSLSLSGRGDLTRDEQPAIVRLENQASTYNFITTHYGSVNCGKG